MSKQDCSCNRFNTLKETKKNPFLSKKNLKIKNHRIHNHRTHDGPIFLKTNIEMKKVVLPKILSDNVAGIILIKDRMAKIQTDMVIIEVLVLEKKPDLKHLHQKNLKWKKTIFPL